MNGAKVLIAGASGLIGSRLTQILIGQGFSVAHLGRSRKSGSVPGYVWNVDEGQVDVNAFRGCEAIINLAGAGIADKRWTKKRKREILESRTKSVALLLKHVKDFPNVKAFVSASAIGYYGVQDHKKKFVESDPPGNDFLAEVTKSWEEEVFNHSYSGLRTLVLRVGIVLSANGGALKEIVRPVRLGFGAPLGSGRQQLPWIHIDDLCGMFVKAVADNSMQGIYNAVGPYSVSNSELTKAIAKVLNRPLILPKVPPFVLHLMLGEMSGMVLNGVEVSSDKIQRAGFKFKFATLEDALNNLLAPPQ